MNYLDKYDNFVFKKCLDTRRVNTFELNNLAKGKMTKSHFGGYVAQKLTKEQLIVAIKSKFEGRYVNEKVNKKVIEDLEDLELAELLQIYESEYYWDNLHEAGDVSGDEDAGDEDAGDDGVSSEHTDEMDVWLAEAAREARTPNSNLFDREPPSRSPVTPGRASMLWHRMDMHNPLSETAIKGYGKLQRFENQRGHPLANMKSQTTGRPMTLKYPDDIQESLNEKYSRPNI